MTFPSFSPLSSPSSVGAGKKRVEMRLVGEKRRGEKSPIAEKRFRGKGGAHLRTDEGTE